MSICILVRVPHSFKTYHDHTPSHSYQATRVNKCVSGDERE